MTDKKSIWRIKFLQSLSLTILFFRNQQNAKFMMATGKPKFSWKIAIKWCVCVCMQHYSITTATLGSKYSKLKCVKSRTFQITQAKYIARSAGLPSGLNDRSSVVVTAYLTLNLQCRQRNAAFFGTTQLLPQTFTFLVQKQRVLLDSSTKCISLHHR